MNARVALLTLTAFALGACSRDRDPVAPPPAPPEAGTVAYLAISDTVAPAGTVITVLARARGDKAVGSFAARLFYDPSRLKYAETVALDGMRVVNALVPGSIVAAGAAPAGFSDDQLFAIRFVTLAAGHVGDLSLDVPELVGVDYGDKRAALSIRRELFLETSLP